MSRGKRGWFGQALAFMFVCIVGGDSRMSKGPLRASVLISRMPALRLWFLSFFVAFASVMAAVLAQMVPKSGRSLGKLSKASRAEVVCGSFGAECAAIWVLLSLVLDMAWSPRLVRR